MSIIIKRSKLCGTCYVEFYPGEYSSQCWNSESIFLSEEDIELILPVFKVVKKFDYYGFIRIDEKNWIKIIKELNGLKLLIENGNTDDLKNYYRNHYSGNDRCFSSLTRRKRSTLKLINEFIGWVENELKTTKVIWYLGMWIKMDFVVKKIKHHKKNVTRKDALRIVRNHLIKMISRNFEIQDGVPNGCVFYGISGDKPCWSVRIPSKHSGTGTDHYVCICKKTSKIIYDGLVGE